jgi:hypothetical protein
MFGKALKFKELRAEASECNPERRREVYDEISAELMATIALLESKTD